MKEEYSFYRDALCACYSDVASAFPAHKIEHRRDVDTILHRFNEEGMGFLTKTLPSLAKAIDIALATGTSLQPPAFARTKGSKLPRFLGWLLGRVFDTNGMELAEADPIALQYLRQLLGLFYKLELPYTEDQTNHIYETFKSTDQELNRPWNLPEPQHRYAVKYARGLVHKVLGSLCPRDISPKHGPGSVATGQRPSGKPHFGVFHEALHEYYPWDQYMCFGPTHVVDSLAKGEPRFVGRDGKDLEVREAGTARVVLVPKDSRGPRLISMEPLEIQWIQQGQLSALVERIESHWLTSGYVNFSKQEVNRALAYHASAGPNGHHGTAVGESQRAPWCFAPDEDPAVQQPMAVELRRQQVVGKPLFGAMGPRGHSEDGRNPSSEPVSRSRFRPIRTRGSGSDAGPYDLVTLDMKDASDRVSLQLVQSLFPTEWVKALEATRSTKTMLPTGETVTLNKFAPMGSAVCFPIEALCFWALALSGIHLRNPTVPLTQLKERIWVYGDDIITYRKDYPEVIRCLEAVGLKFNAAKCCTHGSFRESCGMDAFKGVNVTPVRIRSRWCHRLGVQSLASYVSYSNDLHERGFTELACYIEVMLQRQFPKIPYTTVDTGNIQFLRPHSNTIKINRQRGVRMRFNPRLHTLEAIGPKSAAVTEKGVKDSWSVVLYTMAQRRALRSDSSEAVPNPLKGSAQALEAGLYPLPHRITSKWGWTRVG